jgi:hypothetical protein
LGNLFQCLIGVSVYLAPDGSNSSEDEDRSSTRTFSEGPPCSKTGEEISNRDPDGGGDPDSTGGGVEPPLGEEEPSMERE